MLVAAVTSMNVPARSDSFASRNALLHKENQKRLGFAGSHVGDLDRPKGLARAWGDDVRRKRGRACR